MSKPRAAYQTPNRRSSGSSTSSDSRTSAHKSDGQPTTIEADCVYRVPPRCPRILRVVDPDFDSLFTSGYYSKYWYLSTQDDGSVVPLVDYGSSTSSRKVNAMMTESPAQCLRSATDLDAGAVICEETSRGRTIGGASIVEAPKNIAEIPPATWKRLHFADTADPTKIDIRQVLESLDGDYYVLYRFGERNYSPGVDYRAQKRKVRLLTKAELEHLAKTLADLKAGKKISYEWAVDQCFTVPRHCPRLLSTLVGSALYRGGRALPSYYWLNTSDDGTVTILCDPGCSDGFVRSEFYARPDRFVRKLDQPDEHYLRMDAETSRLHLVKAPDYARNAPRNPPALSPSDVGGKSGASQPMQGEDLLRALDGRLWMVTQRSKYGLIQRVRPVTKAEAAAITRLFPHLSKLRSTRVSGTRRHGELGSALAGGLRGATHKGGHARLRQKRQLRAGQASKH